MDYYSTLGKTGGLYPEKAKGRGLVKQDNVYEFQIAHIGEPEAIYEDIQALCKKLQEAPDTTNATRIPILPEVVNEDFFANTAISLRQFPIGVNKNNLNTEYLQLSANYVTILAANAPEKPIPLAQGMAEILSAKIGIDTTVLDADSLFTPNDGASYKHICQEMNTAVSDLFELVVSRHEAHVKNKAAEFTHIAYVITSLSGLIKMLDIDAADQLNLLLENGKSIHGINIIITDTATGISSYATKPWYKIHSGGDGIWVGDGVADQYSLNISKRTNELYQEIGSDFGFIISKGRYKLTKLLKSDNVIIGDEDA